MDGEELLLTDAWRRPESGSAPERLAHYYSWLTFWLQVNGPEMASIEFLSVERNAQTTRVVSHYQAVSALACKRQGLVVVEGRVSSARKIALGKGNLAKKDAFDLVRQKFPDHDFGRWTKTGTPAGDKADAVVMALAARTLAEQ